MTNRQRAMAILNYKSADRMPVVHFGYWGETLQKWVSEGYLKQSDIDGVYDGSPADKALDAIIGWDFDWYSTFGAHAGLLPAFEPKVVDQLEDGAYTMLNPDGMIELHKPGAGSIPAEIDHTLKDRDAWEKEYKWRLQWDASKRVHLPSVEANSGDPEAREYPVGIYCGSLYGQIRNWLGVQGIAFLYADDDELYEEIIDTVGELCYQGVKACLEAGAKPDFGHFWEDICFKNGPLVRPSVFRDYVGKHYKRITDLLKQYGVEIVSLDCDGCIDALVPIWLDNGVNTMFPMEVGTWNASIAPWREQYGKQVRGVGGMNKVVFSREKSDIDAEIERLKPLIDLGGYIPCPDHRIAPDAKFENVIYYVERMHKLS